MTRLTHDEVDIAESLRGLCDILGFEDYDAVRTLEIHPTYAVASVYLRDENGNKYVDEDWIPAYEDKFFKVRS